MWKDIVKSQWVTLKAWEQGETIPHFTDEIAQKIKYYINENDIQSIIIVFETD